MFLAIKKLFKYKYELINILKYLKHLCHLSSPLSKLNGSQSFRETGQSIIQYYPYSCR